METYLKLLGRIFIAIIFLLAAFNKITGFDGMLQYMKSAGMTYLTVFWLIGAIVFITFGSISFIIGWKLKWGGLALLIFITTATLIFHTDFSDQNQMTQFLKNLAIAGGILFVMASDPGRFSLEQSINNKNRSDEKK